MRASSVRGVSGFQRNLKSAIQARWGKPKVDAGEKLNIVMMEDLRPGGRERRLKEQEERETKTNEKKAIYVSPHDFY